MITINLLNVQSSMLLRFTDDSFDERILSTIGVNPSRHWLHWFPIQSRCQQQYQSLTWTLLPWYHRQSSSREGMSNEHVTHVPSVWGMHSMLPQMVFNSWQPFESYPPRIPSRAMSIGGKENTAIVIHHIFLGWCITYTYHTFILFTIEHGLDRL